MEHTPPMQIVRRFVNDRENFLLDLLRETPSLFKEKPGIAKRRNQ